MKKLTKRLVMVLLSLLCMLSSLPQIMFTSAESSITYEAEDAELYSLSVTYDSAASGGQCVENFGDSSSIIRFNVNVAQNGYYDIIVSSKAMGGAKRNNLYVNDESYGEFSSDSSDQFTETKMQYVYFNSGNNTIEIKKAGAGYILII